MQPNNMLGYMLQHVAAVICKQADQIMQKELDIRLSQLRILMLLTKDLELQQSQIADGLGQTEASVSRQIQVLSERGLLTANLDKVNKRKHSIRSTAKGVALTQAAHQLLSDSFGPHYDAMGAGQSAQLLNGLQLLHEQLCQPGMVGACDPNHQPKLPAASLN